ncbi:MAG: hypothetical protein KA970_01570 [Alicycliphilus sp.]|nr:hypothetical protein [Alicycliphilus sp.]
MSAQSGSRVYLFDSKASSKLVLAAIVERTKNLVRALVVRQGRLGFEAAQSNRYHSHSLLRFVYKR